MAEGNYQTYVTEAKSVIWTVAASPTVRLAGTFVNFAGTNVFTGLGFMGVLNADLPANATNLPVGVDMEGIVQAIAGAPIGLGQAVTCQALTGEFIPAAAGQDVHGHATVPATAAGQRFLMKITREGKA
jgi:Uncharacterized conserved protein (DUF2190)